MAIAVDAVSTPVGGASLGVSDTITVAHTCSGSDRYIIAFVSLTCGSNPGGTCTYNTVSMPQIGTVVRETQNGNTLLMFGLAPTFGGTHDVVFTLSGASSSYYAMNVVSYTGVDPDTPIGTPNTNSGVEGNPALAIASATDEVAVAGAAFSGAVSGHGGSQTERWNNNDNAGTECSDMAGATTCNFSLTLGDAWAYGGVSMKPVGGAPPPDFVPNKIINVSQAVARANLQ